MTNTATQLVFAFVTCLILVAPAFCQKPEIVGMSIACSNDRVYTWYSDSTVSIGNSENLSAYEPPHNYSLPFGKTPEDIVEIGIAKNDHVYTWYKDKTVSSGTSTDLDKHQPRHPYRLARFESSTLGVVGIDIACSNDHVYVWYASGYMSAGTSEDLDKYISLPPRHFIVAATENIRSIVGMGISRNDQVYTWYRDLKVSAGSSTSLAMQRKPYEYILGPGPCDISADAPKLNGRTVFGVGIRGPDCRTLGVVIVRIKSAGTVPRILSEKRATGGNFEVPITFQCSGNGQLTLFTEIQNRERTVKSANSTINDCF